MAAEPTQTTGIHIRWMIRRDMTDVLEIENASFEFPWNEDDFVRCLRQRNCIGMVVEQDDEIVGFMIYELYKTRLHILNFAVHQNQRRSGIGTVMVEKLKSTVNHCLTRITIFRSLAGNSILCARAIRACHLSAPFLPDEDHGVVPSTTRVALVINGPSCAACNFIVGYASLEYEIVFPVTRIGHSDALVGIV